MENTYRLAIISIILFVGCSSATEKTPQPVQEIVPLVVPEDIRQYDSLTVYSADAKPPLDIEFKREMSFDETAEILIGSIGKVAVDQSNRVFLMDKDQLLIHVYNPDGSYSTSLGRKGRGPGEFQNLHSIRIHSDQLWAVDGNAIPLRINTYSLDSLTFVKTVKLKAENLGDFEKLRGYTPRTFYPLADGRLFIVGYRNLFPSNHPTERYVRYYLQNESGEIISDQVLEQKNKYIVHKFPGYTVAYGDFPFLAGSLFAISKEGNIYSARTDKFLVKVYNRYGDYLNEFEYPFRRKKINREEIMKIAENDTRREVIVNSELPERWPALESMLVDDKNRLWVSTIVDDLQVREWWILKDNGKVITKFIWPVDKPIEEVKNGYLYARETDMETGLQEIVRYRIKMN